MNVVYFKDLVE